MAANPVFFDVPIRKEIPVKRGYLTGFIAVSMASVLMSGCAKTSTDDYSKAINRYMDSKFADGAGACYSLQNSAFDSPSLSFKHQDPDQILNHCKKLLNKEYPIALPNVPAESNEISTLTYIASHGYLEENKASCSYETSHNTLLGDISANPKPVITHFHYEIDQFRPSSKNVKYVLPTGFFGGKELCFGPAHVSKIISSTKPHYNDKYSAKTVQIVAEIVPIVPSWFKEHKFEVVAHMKKADDSHKLEFILEKTSKGWSVISAKAVSD
jgi:hypothetical protein